MTHLAFLINGLRVNLSLLLKCPALPSGYLRMREALGNLHRSLRVALAAPLKPARWLFVVGCYNSGTTLLSAMLAEHPEIGSLPDEGQYLTRELICDYEIGVPRMWSKREDLFRWHAGYLGPDVERIRKEWGARINRRTAVVLEKTPANIARMLWLQANFRDAYFVAIIRNGYAVAEGIRRKARIDGGGEIWAINDCARQWRRCVEVLEEDKPAIEHIMELRYEDFVAEPMAHLARIWAFVGVDPTFLPPDRPDWTIHERTARVKDLNRESLDRLSLIDIEAIRREAGEALTRYRYDSSQSG